MKTIGKKRAPDQGRLEFDSGVRHSSYAPESDYNVTSTGKKIKATVVKRMAPRQVYTLGRPVQWRRTEGGFKEPIEGEGRGYPATKLKALRPLGPKDKPQYAAPKGMGWKTIEETDIQPGEKFKEVPVFERGPQRLNWKNYLRAQSEIQKIPVGEVWNKHKALTQEENAGERVGPRELRYKTVQHIQNQMQRHRDFLAGETKESLAIIRAKDASLESAKAHPERMVEYKQRLSDLASKQQKVSKSARERAGGRLSKIAARGMTVVAEEHQGDWQARLGKLHRDLKAAASPEEANELNKQIHQHFLIRKSAEDIKAQGRGAIGLITDKPYEHGGTPLSEISISSIQDILQKGSRTPFRVQHPSKPFPGVKQQTIGAGRIRQLKKRMDESFERTTKSGLGEVKKKILNEGKIFKTPIKEVPTGYPHLGKLGIGIGAAGLLAGGALAIHAARKRSRTQEFRSRLREIRFALPPEADKALSDYAKRIWDKAEKTGLSTSSIPIPGTTSEAMSVKPLRASIIAHQKWKKMVKAFSGSKVEPLHPMDMQKLRALQDTHAKNLDVIKTLKEQARTHEHLREEALKGQAEKLGVEHYAKEKEGFTKGQRTGREEGIKSAQVGHEKRIGELTESLGKESDKRAGRLKLIAAGTLAGGALAGYGLGRHDKSAYQRHEARQVLDMYKPRQPRQQTRSPSHTVLTIGISGGNGTVTKRKDVQFSSLDKVRDKLSTTEESEPSPAHDIATGAVEGGLGYLATDRILKKFGPKNLGPLGKFGVAAGLGGVSTGLIGYGLNRLIRKKIAQKKQQTNMSSRLRSIQFQSKNQRALVARDRYSKEIHDRDVDLANRHYIRASMLGGALGAINRKKLGGLSTGILTGIGSGIAAQKIARIYGSSTRDQFGERSYEGKRVERVPGIVGGLALAGYGLSKLAKHKFSSRTRLIRFQDQQQDEGPEWLQDWARKKLYGRSYSTAGQAQKIKKWGGRTHRLVRDLNTKRQGLPNVDPRGRPRKNEWERPWVAGALTTAGLIGVIHGTRAGVRFVKGAHPDSWLGQMKEGFLRGAPAAHVPKPIVKVGGFFHGMREELVRWRDKPLKGPLKYEHSLVNQETGKRLTPGQIAKQTEDKKVKEKFENIAQGKLYKTDFRSRLREIQFKLVDNPLYPKDKKSSVQRIPISKIVSPQELVSDKRVETYKKKSGRKLPELHKVKGKYYVEDGNHRIVSKIEKGDTTVRARVLEMQRRLREIRFDVVPPVAPDKPKRKHNIAAGLLIGASGLSLYKGAGKMARAAGMLGHSKNAGHRVADYIESSQHVLNQGVTGKVMGAALRHPEHRASKWVLGKGQSVLGELGSGKVGINEVSRAHFSSFRSSHKDALDSLASETVDHYEKSAHTALVAGNAKKAQERLNDAKELRRHYRRLDDHLQNLRFQGYNEREAIREAANDPRHDKLFNRMAEFKSSVMPEYAKMTAALAAVPATAALATAATTRKNRTNNVSKIP